MPGRKSNHDVIQMVAIVTMQIVVPNKFDNVNSLRLVVFLIFLSLPMFSGVIGFIDRSIVNVFSVISSAIIYIFLYRKAKFTSQIYLLYLFFVVFLYVQFAKTAFEYDLTDGLATLLRYCFYLTVGIVTYQCGLNLRSMNTVISTAIIICLFSALIGVVLNRYIFLNGVERFMGAHHSSAGLSLQASVCLFLIYVKFWFLEPERTLFSLSSTKWLVLAFLLFVILVSTGSRQPLLGILSVAAMQLYFYKKKYFLLLLLMGFVFGGMLLEASSSSTNRLILLATKLADISTLSDLEGIRDGSLAARINYMRVGVAHIIDNNLIFGAGLNSFQGIYESATGKDGVAAHNDLLLILVEFGYIGFLMFSIFMLRFLFLGIKQSSPFSLSIIVFWLSGLSLNNLFYYHSVATLMVILVSISMLSRNANFKSYRLEH